ncbi:clavesin-2 isoform X1 [Manis pentadactyla]|uniref:clavesin-2 isoform X1 n=2 Tax=Manis pentadactyla TaxID=143292 RepID=UPI0018752601|nr:clavesin-2 isoform X1 [Manis pentadactyla]KAI5193834.1 Clavesin-2 [Manis pentadactyla]
MPGSAALLSVPASGCAEKLRERRSNRGLTEHQRQFPVKKRKQAASRCGGRSVVVVARARCVVGQSARGREGSGTSRTMTHLQAGLSPETLEKARLELNENPDTLHQDIQEVRDMVITRPDIGFLRTDDAFILRFLRARKFHHFEAFRLLAQYFEYRQQNLDMFKSFKATDPGIKQALKDGFPGGLANLDHYGRKILVLFAANWDQSRYTLVDILRAILLSLEAMIEDPELQVNGFVLIIDWSNFTFKQASKLTPSMLRLAIEGLQDSFPARFGGIHFVNQPWYIHALYTVIRPFLKEKTRKRIFLHGNNLNSLHQLIHPEILPSEFGGMLPPYDMGTWARTLLDHEYDDDSEYSVDSYSMPVKEAEKELSPKSMKRSQSVVDPTVLKRMDQNEEENMQPLLSLD